MAVFLNVCFLGFVLLLAYAIICLVVGVGLSAFAVRRKGLWIASTFPVYVAAVVAYGFWSTRPAAVFEDQFGFAPTADVHDLESSQWILGDTGHATLSFTASAQTVERIVARGLVRLSDENGQQRYRRDFSDCFADERAELSYDPRTRHAFFEWNAVD
jgi:hypothetical protein